VSGIAGIVRLDGRPQPSAHAPALLRAIAQRGPDATGQWSDQSTLLLHTQLRTTAESCLEPQPWSDPSGMVLVADLRLDYRDELLTLLQLRSQPGAIVGDAQLVLAAYQRWGLQCPAYLNGDFAFALWDKAQRRLFCARDPFGVRPFVYCLLPGKLFAFASQMRALLALDEMPRELDEERIAAFLSVHFHDTHSTFYRQLHRLPGGHTLCLQDGRLRVTRYWELDRVRPLHLSSDAEYAAGFRDCFTGAVRTRLRTTHASQLGSILSGGLDSSAITCSARDALANSGTRLPVFSWIFSDVMEADEREYQDIVVAAGGLQRHTIDSATASYSPWTSLERFMPDGPLYAPNFYLNYALGKVARDAGVRAILDGLGGDSTVSWGSARLIELLWRGRPRTLAHELRSMARVQGVQSSLLRMFLVNVLAPLAPPSLLGAVQNWRGRHAASAGPTLLAPRLAAMTDAVSPRYELWLTARQHHLAELRSPMIAEGLEMVDRVLADCQIEGRYPFFDRRLAEFCVALPAEQKLADGYSRVVARRALQGSLPPEIQWRAGKGKPGLHIIPAMLAQRSRLDDLLVKDPTAIAPYVDVDAVRALYQRFVQQHSLPFSSVLRLWSVAVLGQWLRCTQGELCGK
jgi:asparagine synthase (glutamine-hydrolysing)